MAFVTSQQGEVALLKYMLNHSAATNVRLHLYKNNQTPAPTDTMSNYTESTAGGYVNYVLTGSLWTIATVSSTSSAAYARQTFSYTTSETLYGYYITSNDNNILLWAERFAAAPFSLPVNGGSVDIDTRLTLI